MSADECPAGGEHQWARVTGETNVGVSDGVCCDECGATKRENERGPR